MEGKRRSPPEMKFLTCFFPSLGHGRVGLPAWRAVRLHLPSRPVENSYIESFNGRLRDECLNVEVFFTLADVREKLERWREDYNQVRPHSALHDQSPRTFATTWAPSAAFASTSWPANHTLAGVVRSAAAANPESGQLFVRPSAVMKSAAEKLVSEGTSIAADSGVLREVLT